MMTKRWPLGLIALILAVTWLPGCSEDSPIRPGDQGDTTPPMVIATRPLDRAGGVDLHEPLEIQFNEAMDRDSAQGNITVTGSAIVAIAWEDDRTVLVHHSGFAEGSRDTLTLGRGLTDLAGNGLAASYQVGFLTVSPDLVVMDVTPAVGSSGVPLNVGILLHLSEGVETAAIADAVTVSDETTGGAKAAIGFTVQDRRYDTYGLVPDADLPAESVIHVHISDQLATPGGKTPAAPVHFSFTTGTERDTTPPRVVALEPPHGATNVPPDQGFYRITFSEPVARMVPPAPVNLTYDLIMTGYYGEQAAQWNADRTQLTMGLPPGLAAGLPFDLTYRMVEDMNGVQETTPWPYRFRVAGTPDYLPFPAGERYMDFWTIEAGPSGAPADKAIGFGRAYIRIDYLSADTFHEAGYFNPNPAGDPFQVPSGAYDAYRWTDNALEWSGWEAPPEAPEKSNDIDPPLTVVPLPLAAGTWTDAATVTVADEGTYDVTLAGTVLPQHDYVLPRRSGRVFVKDAWVVVMESTWELAGTPAATRLDTVVYAPGFGPVKRISRREDHLAATWQRQETTRFPYTEFQPFAAGR